MAWNTESDPLLRAGIALQPGFNKLHIAEDQFQPSVLVGQHAVGIHELIFTHHLNLGIGLLLRLHEFVGSIQARVFEVMPAPRNVGDSKSANFHAG